MSVTPKLSIIIPCRGDVGTLSALLPQLVSEHPVEIIVVSDRTDSALQERCGKADARALFIDGVRGLRLRRAAGEARSKYLWFLHADATLTVGAADAIIDAFASDLIGGYLRFRLTGDRTLVKRLIELGVELRCRIGGIPYGDQGIFVTKSAYEAAGGHESLPLFDEFRLLRRLTKENLFKQIDMSIGVDPQRWDRNGYIRHTIKNRMMSLAYTLGVSPGRLARWYYN